MPSFKDLVSGSRFLLLLLAITGLLTRPHPFRKAADTADYQKAAENTDVPSTNIDKPTLLTSNEIRGNGVGEKISYYYTFNAGPGEVKVTVDGKNKNVAGSAIAVEISDLDAKRLLYISLGNTTVGKRKVERSQLGRRQQVILRILLGEGSLDYMVRLEGAGDFNAQRSQ